MQVPFIDWIWRAKGSVPLEQPMTPASVFDKLDHLLQTHGTEYKIEGDVLRFKKDNPAAQDKLATFTRGTLRVTKRQGQPVLAYDVTSPALLFCFLAPLLFLAFGQATVAIGKYENSKPEIVSDAEPEAKAEDDEPKKLHPLDEFLGVPAPVVLTDEEKEAKKQEDKAKKFSPTTAYVLASIFAALYLVGRFLEPWLLRSRLRKTLAENAMPQEPQPSE